MKFNILFLLILIASINISAQTVTQSKGRKLVSLPVSVSDREGRYIAGLKKEDFTIYQDGVKQKVDFFATFDEPLNIVLLLDTSGSTEGDALLKIKDAAKEFVEMLNTKDQCQIVTFDTEVKYLSKLTNNERELKKAIESAETAQKDGTVLFRAVNQVTKSAFTNSEGRNVIVLLSDGKDLGSELNSIELISQLEEADVLIYPIFYQTGVGIQKLVIDEKGAVKEEVSKKKIKKAKEPKKPRGYSIGIPAAIEIIPEEEIKASEKTANFIAIDFLKEMADTTAGRFYLSDTPNLKKIFKQVAGELRQQYRLGFYSKDISKDVSLHEITVKVEKPNVVVRTRGKFRGN